MKKISFILVIVLCMALLILLTGCKKEQEEPKAPETSAPTTEGTQEPQADPVYSATGGTWKPTADWEGVVSVVRIEMDGKGHFEMYAEDGSLKTCGELRAAEENDTVRFDMYDGAGNYTDGFYIGENGQLTMVEGAAASYEK